MEHRPCLQPHLRGTAAPDRAEGGGAHVRRPPGRVLQGPVRRAHPARRRVPAGPRQLPPRHRVAGPQARRFCPLPPARLALPQPCLPPRLRRAARTARPARRRRRLPAHPATGRDDYGGRRRAGARPAAGGGPALRLPGRARYGRPAPVRPGAGRLAGARPGRLRPPVDRNPAIEARRRRSPGT